MIFWNFKTPITLLGCLMWNTAEFFKFSLGKYAPYIFNIALGCKKMKKN